MGRKRTTLPLNAAALPLLPRPLLPLLLLLLILLFLLPPPLLLLLYLPSLPWLNEEAKKKEEQKP